MTAMMRRLRGLRHFALQDGGALGLELLELRLELHEEDHVRAALVVQVDVQLGGQRAHRLRHFQRRGDCIDKANGG